MKCPNVYYSLQKYSWRGQAKAMLFRHHPCQCGNLPPTRFGGREEIWRGHADKPEIIELLEILTN